MEICEKEKCYGCEACSQVCARKAIEMKEDNEGFRYPYVDLNKCIGCGVCKNVCPANYLPEKHKEDKYIFGGYHNNVDVKAQSTSGGFFSAICSAFADEERYVIFGAEAKGLYVFHSYVNDIAEIDKFRGSKYSQSQVGDSYIKVVEFLNLGYKVLFSGTPCQIAGLRKYIDIKQCMYKENLLLVEVVCEGVPSPLFVRKFEEHVEKRYDGKIIEYDYRNKDMKSFRNIGRGKWDFEVLRIELDNHKIIKKDRWINPFWSVWLQHLMSRPSCYRCGLAMPERVADITLGDLWGVHIFCPELYGNNAGASLAICNTFKGKAVFDKAKRMLYGHELVFEDVVKYQGPLRRPLPTNDKRLACMEDLESNMTYKRFVKKWAVKPSIKLLYSKYVWGNRQKVFAWNLKRKIRNNR